MPHFLLFLAAVVLTLCGGHSVYAQQQNRLSASLGSDYSTGYYGSEDRTEIWYFPALLKYETERSIFKLTVPYLRIKGPAAVISAGDGPIVIPGVRDTTKDSGLGDTFLSGTYNVVPGYGAWPILDATLKIKFPTADKDKGLGSGEYDYSVQFDAAKPLGKTVIFATAGYKIYGDPPEVDFDNIYYGSLGGGYQFARWLNAGLIYDYRQGALDTSADQKEGTAYFSAKLGVKTKLIGYFVKGYSDGSPDWGLGAMLTRTY